MSLKILKYSSFAFLSAVLIISGSLWYLFQTAEAQTIKYDLSGWAYSENFEWISLSSLNCVALGVGSCSGSGIIDYGVKIDTGNNISGYGWSENVGWVCFGDGGGDSSKGCTTSPPSGNLTTTMDEATGKITGWAQIKSLDNDGWIKLGRGASTGGNFGEVCYDCQPECEVWTKDGEDNDIEPCISYSTTNFENCTTCFSETKYNGVSYPIDADNPVVGGSGSICTACNNCHKVDGENRIVCNYDDGFEGSCSNCERYGINRSMEDGSLLGWGWNGGNSDPTIGAGWVQFNNQFGGGFVVFPWLQTMYGSIYTPNDFRQRAIAGGSNATYCIFATSINANIKTQSCEGIASGLVENVVAGFPALSNGGVYRNALGKVDVTGLIAKVSGERNKYGHIVNNLSAGAWSGPVEGVLNGQVYYFDGNVSVSDLTFNNGNNMLGNGVVVINGDLTINGNVVYSLTSPTKLSELASVAWIVKGDVIVNSTVENIAGAFIVLGRDGVACSIADASDPNYPEYSKNSCGVFFSGASNRPLTALGLVIAKAFDFGRTFSQIDQGSERIIYDGRLIANPPPGMKGFTEGLPIIRDFSY